MSNDSENDTEKHDGSNASGSQSGGSAQTWDSVDSGMSEDVENSLTGQGISDRETTVEAARNESEDDRENGKQNTGGGRGR
ncbi:MAG: hypothetical protein ABIQ01_09045 [Pseudolysinimonas sp.]